MKSLIINYFSILLCAQAFFACAPDVKKTPERTFRIIHNNDGSDLLGNRWFKYRPLTLADLDSCVDMVANSQVTTYMMCSGSDFFYVRSKYGHVMGRRSGRDVGLRLRHSSIQLFPKILPEPSEPGKRGDGLGRLYFKESQGERDGSLHHLPDERLAFQ